MATNYTLNKVSDSVFSVLKDGKQEYELKRINGHWACTCSGYYYRGTCKHIDMLKGRVADSELSLENEVYTSGEIEKIKAAVEPIFEGVNHEYSGDYRRVEDDNSEIVSNTTLYRNPETASNLMYTANVYSNLKTGKKAQAKAIMDVVDTQMRNMGFSRTMRSQLPNVDRTIYRVTARYTRVIQTF